MSRTPAMTARLEPAASHAHPKNINTAHKVQPLKHNSEIFSLSFGC